MLEMSKLLGAIAVLVAVTAGCGSSEGEQVSSAAPTPTPTPTPEPTPQLEEHHRFEKGHTRAVREYYGDTHGPEGGIEAEYHQPPMPPTGRIGDTITLTGTNVGVRLDVKVTGLVDPATAARSARDGMRYVGVALQTDNTGITIHDDTFDNALLRSDARGRARPVMGVKANCSNGFHRVVRIEPSAGARGCVLFEVRNSARPREFQLALEQVPPEAGGRWRLR
jgi:hypothetical protein